LKSVSESFFKALNSMDSCCPVLTILPKKLSLTRISKDQLDLCLCSLLKLSFFSKGFFSYTETDEEVSLIIEESALSFFEKGEGNYFPVVVAPKLWKAIQIYEGSSVINAVGVVSRLSASLCQSGINMIYLSTFNTDLILVHEDDEQRAVHLLSQNILSISTLETFPKQVTPDAENTSTISNLTSSTVSDSESLSSALPECEVSSRNLDDSLSANGFSANPPNSSSTSSSLISCSQIAMTTLSNRLFIAALSSKQDFSLCTHALLRQFLFPSGTRLFSLTSSPNEVSMILDDEALASFPENLLIVHGDCWKAIQVLGEGSIGFIGNNIHVFSEILAVASIPIYFLSTFNEDFILVPEKKIEIAVQCLNKYLNIISD